MIPKARLWCSTLFAMACMALHCGPARAICMVGGTRPWPAAEAQALGFEGKVARSWYCKDKLGEHIVAVWRQGGLRDARGVKTTFAQFTRAGAGWKKDWQALDFLPDRTAGMPAPTENVTIEDVDGDGINEVFIAYALPGQLPATDDGKLLVFYKDRKYAIRGAVPRTPEEYGSRKIGASFTDLPQPVQAQAFAMWDKLSEPIDPERLLAAYPSAAGGRFKGKLTTSLAGPLPGTVSRSGDEGLRSNVRR